MLQVYFRSREQGFELVFQDDGQGIVAERLREAAVRRGDVSAAGSRAARHEDDAWA